MRLIDADVLKQHIDKLPALPDGNFAGNHSALKALINMQPTIEPSTSCSEIPNGSDDTISRRAAIDAYGDWYVEEGTEEGFIGTVKQLLEGLPSAQPATNCSEIPNGSDDTISRRAAIDAIEHITTSMSVCVNADECHGMKRMQRQAVLEIANMPAVQPDRDVIDDCLYHIHKNISTHTATGGVIAIRYYMEKLYEEIYGKGERPWWMT